MCLIIYSPDGKIPRRHRAEGLLANPDGWGFMAVEGGQIVIQKGMAPAEFWRAWPQRPPGPVVFHSRTGTHGVQDTSNCHPFLLHGGRLAVAHNGVIARCGTDRVRSDTRVFVEEILEGLPRNFLRRKAIVALIAGYIGHSKLVFIDDTGTVRIVNEGLGHWRKGSWYSNSSYLPPKPAIISAPGQLGRPLIWHRNTYGS